MYQKYIEIGKFDFTTGKVNVTDPSYDNYCYYINIKPGTYIGAVHETDEGVWGKRIKEIAVCLSDHAPDDIFDLEYVYANEIGVDAGLAGIFQDKPDYSRDEWLELCNKQFKNKSYGMLDCGFWSLSGFGDGCYEVHTAVNAQNETVAIKIVFY